MIGHGVAPFFRLDDDDLEDDEDEDDDPDDPDAEEDDEDEQDGDEEEPETWQVRPPGAVPLKGGSSLTSTIELPRLAGIFGSA